MSGASEFLLEGVAGQPQTGIGGIILAQRAGLGPKVEKACQHPIRASRPAWPVPVNSGCVSSQCLFICQNDVISCRSVSSFLLKFKASTPVYNQLEVLLPQVYNLPHLGPILFLLKEEIELDWWFLNLYLATIPFIQAKSLFGALGSLRGLSTSRVS